MRFCQIILTLWLLATPCFAATLSDDFKLWEAQQKADSPSASAVAGLAARHPAWPGINGLVAKVETQKTYNNLDSNALIALFTQRAPDTASGIVAYITALGTTAQSESELRGLWRTVKLDSEAQSRIMREYGARLTMADHDARLDMLLDHDRITQAENMARHLSPRAQDYVAVRAKILRGEITDIAGVPVQYRDRPQILADFAKAYAESENGAAGIAVLKNIGPMTETMGEELWRTRHILARGELEQGRAQNAYALLSQSGLKRGEDFAAAEFMSGFVALKFLNDPKRALQHFYTMYAGVTGAISKARAAYWMGRCAEQLGDRAATQAWYQKAANYPTTYFGQAALRRLGGTVTRATLAERAAAPGQGADADMVAGARYFYQKGMPGYARQFLMAAARSTNSAGVYETLSDMALANDDRAGLVKLAREVGKQGVPASRSGFPFMSAEEREQARLGGMRNMALVHAIIRQESEFDDQAMSGAGARGLMQLMPATAKHVASQKGLRHDVSWLTGRPGHNIRLGSAYLDYLLQKYNGSKVLAIAAYNAGPGRVAQWIARFGDPRTAAIETEDWIELIPVAETRNYIQRVLEGETVYAALL